ncbi:RsfA family transcriptional regulator [Alicyclobacillus acidocaldarius]|uniref:Transcription factor, RsfA family n=1 Tax=Alicyclobacillus acidocaldarius subsp. acidocaldarius (strain ATCC 27009 / DSM 446 / BCRC 14685 / JCM 5260 / KCTC 1825 / NBRC 15652 / NCIMB 11725 / NRRL B-14509 / 104-IA) TaxID=521098 RepID=C8WS56_ALIAD|nr:RsfA family transcriptional regulator [Alicyclobacillus acidocaldarius]ACV57490.1 transcription factor, RsfA family [Alicyclobacillus acidocaldarius subsp. acidocaldarius DSM 446]
MASVEKSPVRSDAWTAEDDERLAQLVLRHIRTGSTQLKAFEEAAEQLGRTAAACGYRWNGVIRKRYRDEIEAAKAERKALHVKTQTQKAATAPTASMQEVIRFLQTYDEQYQRLREYVSAIEREKSELEARVRALESQLREGGPELPLSPEQLEEDSRTLFAIMERARKLLAENRSAGT